MLKLIQVLAPHGSPSIKRQSSLSEGDADAQKGGDDDVDHKLRAIIQKLQRPERVSVPCGAWRAASGAARASRRQRVGAGPSARSTAHHRTAHHHTPPHTAGQRQAGARVLQPAAPAARLARVGGHVAAHH